MICAMGLARLGEPVLFAGVAGQDDWGRYCVAALREAGIDVEAVQLRPGLHTGLTVALSAAHDRALVTYPGAIAALRAQDIPDALLARAGHLHVSSYYLQDALRPGLDGLFARARSLGLSTSLDPGFDPREAWGEAWAELLPQVDVFLPNATEACAISGRSSPEAALEALANGHTRTVIKRGGEGCLTLDDDGRLLALPAFAVDALDSTGAGDSFDAGFLHAWRRNLPLRDCLRWGMACGALSTRGIGGTATQADVAEAERLLAARP
jgi:sugar/nucleoside kinase (ribokinase family)